MADSDWEEENVYVVTELSGFIDDNFLVQHGQGAKVLGLDSHQPYIQIDHNIFQGKYERCVGTCMLFEDHLGNDEDSEATNNTQTLTYIGKTSKILDCKKVFFNEKLAGDEDQTGSSIKCGEQSPAKEKTVGTGETISDKESTQIRDVTNDGGPSSAQNISVSESRPADKQIPIADKKLVNKLKMQNT